MLPDHEGGDEAEERARAEKAAGLAELYASPLSVLIGPAGTGKTTLLTARVDRIGGDRAVLLAPTGQARVQLATKVGGGVKIATLASYLSHTNRFDGGRYLVLDEHGPRVDVLDAFRSIKRLVFVGDPRPLPPIGAGRPLVDLVNELRPDVFAGQVRVGHSYVELRVPRRQVAEASTGAQDTVAGGRADLALAAWFAAATLASTPTRSGSSWRTSRTRTLSATSPGVTVRSGKF